MQTSMVALHATQKTGLAQTRIRMTNWSVYEVPLYGPELAWTRHFVGYCEESGAAKVSEPILTFNPEDGTGSSVSGHVFQLIGQPGRLDQVEAKWERWKFLSQVPVERDVTYQLCKGAVVWSN